MPINSLVLHVADVECSLDFYTRHLSAEVIERDKTHATLGLVTAVLELRHLAQGRLSIWKDDDATQGFRHLGLKVSDLDAIVATLDADGVEFRSRPLDIPDVGVRNAFFFDPDGTVIELVERHLRYHVVHDERAVGDEHAMPEPSRPRFDHVGHTVEDLDAALERYTAAGFHNIGRLEWPSMRLEFMRGGDTVIELFKLPRPSVPNPPVVDSYGLAGVAIEPMPRDADPIGILADGRTLFRDPDDLAIIG